MHVVQGTSIYNINRSVYRVCVLVVPHMGCAHVCFSVWHPFHLCSSFMVSSLGCVLLAKTTYLHCTTGLYSRGGGATPRSWTPTTPTINCWPEAPLGGGAMVGGHEATETGLAYAPVSQAHGHNHIVQCFACCTAA